MARRVLLANPRGFCAGVVRAVEIVERALDLVGPPVYVRKEIVHNKHVVNRLRDRGVIFTDGLEEIPVDSLCVFSAHGVSPAVRDEAKARGLRLLDATCPLVTKVHLEVLRYRKEGLHVLLIGHAGHEEVEGTMGHASGEVSLVQDVAEAERLVVANPERLAAVTQTTLSLDDTSAIMAVLQRRFPALRTPAKSDICYATQNRQDAVKRLAEECDVVLVVGNENSSNSRRLVEVAERAGVSAYLVPAAEKLDREQYAMAGSIGVTSGASTPETAVQALLDRLAAEGWSEVEELDGEPEDVHFPLPQRELEAIGR